MDSYNESEQPGQNNKRIGKRRCTTACETCKRRKERCDGSTPCARCQERGVADECYFIANKKNGSRVDKQHTGSRRTPRVPNRGASSSSISPVEGRDEQINSFSSLSPDDARETYNFKSNQTSETSGLSRLIKDKKGRYMFIGDSANLSFLQVIRHVVRDCIGPCSFADDPLRYLIVEASPADLSAGDNYNAATEPPGISLSEAQDLVKNFLYATNCVLDLFDAEELLEHLGPWIDGRCAESPIPSAMYYLILAIGAQTSPKNEEDLAASLFTYGRHLTVQYFMEDASIWTVQSYALITMYLLGACRRNTAFMYLGIAVRAAYAIGLHRKEVALSFSKEEFSVRERLWKVMRILDLFMSASLGRPPSTAETRDTEADDEYSASNDLCSIFEKILTDVYSRRMISRESLSNISNHHRRWAARFFRGLAMDRIEPLDLLNDSSQPNIGLLHVKEAYYWTIMLLTRPFLTEHVAQISKTITNNASESAGAADSSKVLVHACVDSAIKTIQLLAILQGNETIPKRLPFVINSVFVAALVLGFACFGDLYQIFPLQQYLRVAHDLLAQFSHDAIAQRNASIVGYLREASDLYLEKRWVQNIDHHGQAVGGMFGQIHKGRSERPTRCQSRNDNTGQQQSGQGDAEAEQQQGGQANIYDATMNIPQPQPVSGVPDSSVWPDDDFHDATLPYSIMMSGPLWFDSYDENMPVFSTISNVYNY